MVRLFLRNERRRFGTGSWLERNGPVDRNDMFTCLSLVHAVRAAIQGWVSW